MQSKMIFENKLTTENVWLVVCDFDETFMPVGSLASESFGIEALQEKLAALRGLGQVYFGWATGNSFAVITQKMRDYPDFPWDFALTSLGTELYWNQPQEIVKSMNWPLAQVSNLANRFGQFEKRITEEGVQLVLQEENFQRPCIRGFYLEDDAQTEENIQTIKRLAQDLDLAASITYANSAAGDPAGVYDVAILPLGCGKQQGVAYIQKQLKVKDSQVLAFGDSCNDLEMLNAYEKGYLVANAASEAKSSGIKVLSQAYCFGVLEGIDKEKELSVDSFAKSTSQTTKLGDAPVFDIYFGAFHTYTLFLADEIGLFDSLANEPKDIAKIVEELKLGDRAAQGILSMCESLGLIEQDHGLYYPTTLTHNFLLSKSDYSFQGVLASARKEGEAFSYDFFKASVLQQHSQLYGGTDLFDNNEVSEEGTQVFTHAMHSKSTGPAQAWPSKVDLSSHQSLLDIGGGSGAHSIGALKAWPKLNGLIFDRPLVCEVANSYIQQAQLETRLKTYVGNVWKSDLPPSDVHFYSDIFHDWSPEQCRFLTKKSFESLPSGGKILLHEMCFDNEKAGPKNVAAYNLNMLLWTQGQQFSSLELEQMLKREGFTEVETRKTGFGDWQLVMGVKP